MSTIELNILLVDDHPLILEGYQNVLSKTHFENYVLHIDVAENCDWAWEKITTKSYDVVFLDINFPVSEGTTISSGEDLAIMMRAKYKDIKLVVLTTLEDPMRIYTILKNINPEGFLLKGETSAQELITCFKMVIKNYPFYGARIAKILHSEAVGHYEIDRIDKMILYQLSLGTKTKDIPEHVHLSLRAVEDRKRRLKDIMGVSGKGNRDLLEKARQSGYI